MLSASSRDALTRPGITAERTTSSPLVMAGLDPAIPPRRAQRLPERDAPVKPAHDCGGIVPLRPALVHPLERVAGGIAVLRLDVVPDKLDRARDDRCIVGESYDRQHV